MKVTKHQFSPIQIVLEAPEEVQAVLLALDKFARSVPALADDILADLAYTMYNEIAKLYRENS